MIMNKIKKIEIIVEYILRKVPKSRTNDFILIGCVYSKLGIDIKNKSMFQILNEGKSNKYPIFESITRARRKLINKYPELSDNTTQIMRNEEQKIYKEYSKDI